MPLLALCLESHLLFTRGAVRFVVVDGSDSPFSAWSVFERFRSQLDEREQSAEYVDLRTQGPLYSRSCHEGALRCRREELLIFSNDDTVVTPGWLDLMLEDEARKLNLSGLNRLFVMATFHWLRRRAYGQQDFARMLAQTPFGRGEMAIVPLGIEVSMVR